jgi:predicted ArsR family transcriptional regulator
MHVTDPRRLRALAHPLRLDLLELLTRVGTATAAECARELGSTQANCSFHLRQLAKFGFVEPSDAREDRRERPWRLTDLEQRWSPEAGAAEELEQVFIQRETERMLRWTARSHDAPAEWVDASFLGGMSVPLRAEELEQVRDQLRVVLQPYLDRLSDRDTWPTDARFVRILLSAVPLDDTTPPATASPQEADRSTDQRDHVQDAEGTP